MLNVQKLTFHIFKLLSELGMHFKGPYLTQYVPKIIDFSSRTNFFELETKPNWFQKKTLSFDPSTIKNKIQNSYASTHG